MRPVKKHPSQVDRLLFREVTRTRWKDLERAASSGISMTGPRARSRGACGTCRNRNCGCCRMHRFEWPEEDSAVEFHLGYGDWIRLLRRHGFEVEDLIEVRAPEGAATRYEFVTQHWARHWPSEEIWKVRKRA